MIDKKYTRAEILENRWLWINYLKSSEALKNIGSLEKIIDNIVYRCCLGHGCYALSIPKRTSKDGSRILYNGAYSLAPDFFKFAVGLKNAGGSFGNTVDGLDSLVELNDATDMTSQQIGMWLEKRINGGENTPFIALDEYPETLEKEKNE